MKSSSDRVRATQMPSPALEQKTEPATPVAIQTTHSDGCPVAADTPTCINFTDFNVYYGRFHAVRDVSMSIPGGTIVAFMGPSGCGKSTILRSINRMNDTIPEARTSGELTVDGQQVYIPGVNVMQLRKKVGMVFQKPNPFPASVFENVAWGPRMHGLYRGRDLNDHIEECLHRAGLWDEVKDKLKMNAMSLSGGQQQRLCIARALAVEPSILLMDEPCSALDPLATYRIEDLMRDLVPEYTIVIVTHNMQQAARISQYAAFFWIDESRTGQLVEWAPTTQLFERPGDERTERYITGRMG